MFLGVQDGIVVEKYFDPKVFVVGRVYDVYDSGTFVPMILYAYDENQLTFEFPNSTMLAVKIIHLEDYQRRGRNILRIPVHRL